MAALEVRVGRVVNVSGSQVVILIERSEAEDAPNLQMGELVKMYTPKHTVFGMATGLSIPMPAEDAAATEPADEKPADEGPS